MNGLINGITLTLFGVIIGYISNFLIAKYKARFALKNAIADIKAKYYLDLWNLCEPSNYSDPKIRLEKYNKMKTWYENGGGLFLSFKATNHFMGALRILNTEEDQNKTQASEELKKNLSWIRTEMKYEVGSYSRKEAITKLPKSK